VVEHLPFKQVVEGSIPSTLIKSIESQQVKHLLAFWFLELFGEKSTCLMVDYFKILIERADNECDMFKDMLQQFYFGCRLKNLTEKTLCIYGERLTYFYNYVNKSSIPFENVDKATIQNYILSIKDKVSDHTVNGRIRVLKTFFKYLVEEGLWQNPNPMERISFIRTERKIKPVLSPEEMERILGSIKRNTFTGMRNYCLVSVFWDSLIRLSELINIRVDNLDLKSGSLKVMGKGRKERIVPLGAKTVKCLHRFWISQRQTIQSDYFFCDQRGRPLEKRNVQRILERLEKKTGLHITPHLLRHSGATFLALTGCPAFLLQKLLGHTTLSTTQIYINLKDDERLKQAFLKYSPMDALRI
jgi:integrase/recombinase XerD